MSNFNLNIYTPNGIVIENLGCDTFTIPTVKGEINVLEGHTHIVSEVETGILTAKTQMGDRHFSMTAGLVKILGDKVVVLSTTSEKAEDIDIERAKAAKAKAESRLASNEPITDVDTIKFRRKLERAKARLTLGSKK